MPAVELVRLQNDTQRLLELFHQPDAFVLRLQELLDFFSDRTARRMLSMSAFQVADRYSASTVGAEYLAALVVDPL